MSDRQKIEEALEILRKAATHQHIDIAGFVKNLYAQAKVLEEKAVEKAKDVAVNVAGDVDKSVHENAWTYVGTAALTGLILGYLSHRRRGR